MRVRACMCVYTCVWGGVRVCVCVCGGRLRSEIEMSPTAHSLSRVMHLKFNMKLTMKCVQGQKTIQQITK